MQHGQSTRLWDAVGPEPSLRWPRLFANTAGDSPYHKGKTMTADVRQGRPSRAARAAFAWFTLSAAAIAVFTPLPYLTESLSTLAEAPTGAIAANYADRPTAIQVAFYAHVIGGGLALALSPPQFIARLRHRVPRAHRAIGRLAVGSMVVGGVAGAVLSTTNLAGPVGTAGFGLLGVLWVAFAVTAVVAIRRGDVAAHRRWMVRAFALTYAAVTLRLWLGLLIGVHVAAGVPQSEAFDRSYLFVPFLCWVPNLLVAELYLRRRSQSRERHQRPTPGFGATVTLASRRVAQTRR